MSSPFRVLLARIIYTAMIAFVVFSIFSNFYILRQSHPPGRSFYSSVDVRIGQSDTDADTKSPPSVQSLYVIPSSNSATIPVDAGGVRLTKPIGSKIVAIIFYGRRHRASILDCYIRKNLASNGGWLDEVIWAVNTDIEGDQIYVKEIAKTVPEYKIRSVSVSYNSNGFRNYKNVWNEAFTEEDAIYVKIDDDIIFMEDSAIPRLVTTLVQNPDALVVSSNVVNNPALGWVHYHMGAVHPYMPEVVPKSHHLATRDNGLWRASQLHHQDSVSWQKPDISEIYRVFDVDGDDAIPKHRWLPISDPKYIRQTPIALSQFDPFGPNLKWWALGAQAHYSLLRNIEAKELSRYFMIRDARGPTRISSTWDMTGTRISINCLAIRGRDVFEHRENITLEDDELALSVDLPLAIGRSVLVETTSVVAHFNFGPQKPITATDLLERYHNYAAENVCPKGLREPEVYYDGEELEGSSHHRDDGEALSERDSVDDLLRGES